MLCAVSLLLIGGAGGGGGGVVIIIIIAVVIFIKRSEFLVLLHVFYLRGTLYFD